MSILALFSPETAPPPAKTTLGKVLQCCLWDHEKIDLKPIQDVPVSNGIATLDDIVAGITQIYKYYGEKYGGAGPEELQQEADTISSQIRKSFDHFSQNPATAAVFQRGPTNRVSVIPTRMNSDGELKVCGALLLLTHHESADPLRQMFGEYFVEIHHETVDPLRRMFGKRFADYIGNTKLFLDILTYGLKTLEVAGGMASAAAARFRK